MEQCQHCARRAQIYQLDCGHRFCFECLQKGYQYKLFVCHACGVASENFPRIGQLLKTKNYVQQEKNVPENPGCFARPVTPIPCGYKLYMSGESGLFREKRVDSALIASEPDAMVIISLRYQHPQQQTQSNECFSLYILPYHKRKPDFLNMVLYCQKRDCKVGITIIIGNSHSATQPFTHCFRHVFAKQLLSIPIGPTQFLLTKFGAEFDVSVQFELYQAEELQVKDLKSPAAKYYFYDAQSSHQRAEHYPQPTQNATQPTQSVLQYPIYNADRHYPYARNLLAGQSENQLEAYRQPQDAVDRATPTQSEHKKAEPTGQDTSLAARNVENAADSGAQKPPSEKNYIDELPNFVLDVTNPKGFADIILMYNAQRGKQEDSEIRASQGSAQSGRAEVEAEVARQAAQISSQLLYISQLKARIQYNEQESARIGHYQQVIQQQRYQLIKYQNAMRSIAQLTDPVLNKNTPINYAEHDYCVQEPLVSILEIKPARFNATKQSGPVRLRLANYRYFTTIKSPAFQRFEGGRFDANTLARSALARDLFCKCCECGSVEGVQQQ